MGRSGWKATIKSTFAGFLAQYQAFAVGRDIDRDDVPVVNLAGQQQPGELVADGLLDKSPQRPRALDRVEPAVGQPFLGRQRYL